LAKLAADQGVPINKDVELEDALSPITPDKPLAFEPLEQLEHGG
jgi:hypothetical protein